MFNYIKNLYVKTINEWTEEINHIRMIALLNEIKTHEGDNYDTRNQID